MLFRRTPKPMGSAAAKALVLEVERCLENAAQKRLEAMATTMASIPDNWQASLIDGAAYLQEITAVREAMRRVRLAGDIQPVSSELHYVVSSLFLRECWQFLTGDDKGRERMALITGPVTPDGTHILSSLQHVTMASQSPSYVQANPAPTHTQIVKLVEEDQHKLMGMWHSHIMRGAASTKPSVTDLSNQQRMVDIGWTNTIAGIFNLDGYVRLFSTARDFELTIYGNRFEMLEETPREKLIKLEISEV